MPHKRSQLLPVGLRDTSISLTKEQIDAAIQERIEGAVKKLRATKKPVAISNVALKLQVSDSVVRNFLSTHEEFAKGLRIDVVRQPKRTERKWGNGGSAPLTPADFAKAYTDAALQCIRRGISPTCEEIASIAGQKLKVNVQASSVRTYYQIHTQEAVTYNIDVRRTRSLSLR